MPLAQSSEGIRTHVREAVLRSPVSREASPAERGVQGRTRRLHRRGGADPR